LQLPAARAISLCPGVTGGVESMTQFKQWFFPGGGNSSFYCKYNNKPLQAYSAIMHFTGSLASIVASYCTQHWGRKGWVKP